MGQGLMARAAFESELERADGFWHLNGPIRLVKMALFDEPMVS